MKQNNNRVVHENDKKKMRNQERENRDIPFKEREIEEVIFSFDWKQNLIFNDSL
jgi:hypothetical protein